MASSSSAPSKNTVTVSKGETIQTQEKPAIGHEDFIDEPNVSWNNHVLIPADKPFTHALLGPLPDPIETDEIKEIFPSHHQLQPRIFDNETSFQLEFLKKPNIVFRSGPRVNQNDYKKWLDKVQAKKETVWKEQGIFDIIQLSRYGPEYNSTLLLAAIHFWDISTHSLHLKCGMISPTLFVIAAITGLKPLGETFNPKLPVNNDFNFATAKANFSPYIFEHHITDIEEVSDLEHIAFLTLWISTFVFCSHSIQVSKTFIPLAIQLHERRDINLAKLILGTFHQGLDEAVVELKEKEITNNLNFADPMWLLQLWLVATFKLKLGLIVPKDIRPSMATRRIEGIRLAQLKSKKQRNLNPEKAFSAYLEMFLNCDTFEETMAPFVRCTYGPDWFKEEFPSNTPERIEETNQIWQAYLSPAVLSARLSPSSGKNQLGISRYFPSHFSRQFGLCQLRPAPVYLHIKELYTPKTELEYKLAFESFQYKDLVFYPIKFNPRNDCIEKFHKWWLEYFTAVSGERTDADLLGALNSVLPSRLKAEGKTKADTPKKQAAKASSSAKSTKSTTKPKIKSPTESTTISKKKTETKSSSNPTSKKRKSRSLSPIARMDPHEKQPILSSSEETDSEDSIPLSLLSKLQSIVAKRSNKGISIQEPGEQAPTKKTKPSGTQPKGLPDGSSWKLDSFTKAFISKLKSVAGEIFGLKSIAAYRSGLEINTTVTKNDSEKGLKQVLLDGKPFRIANKNFIDYIFLQSLEVAQSYDLPMQIHAGFGHKDLDMRQLNPLYLRSVLEDVRYSKSRIVLLHASYPFSREASYLASVYPQVYLDFGLPIPKLSVNGMISSLKELLEMTPINKVMFSTDGYAFPETFYLGAKKSREVVFSVLRDTCIDGDLSIPEAVEAAKDIFARNAIHFYKISVADNAVVSSHNNLPQTLNDSLETDLSLVRLLWVDTSGQHRCRAIPRKRFNDVITKNGVGLAFAVMGMTSFMDGFAAGSGLSSVGETRLMPDLSTKMRIPWNKQDEMVLVDMVVKPGEAWEYCPREALRRASKILKDEFNLVMNAGFENEFYLLKSITRVLDPPLAASHILREITAAIHSYAISVEQIGSPPKILSH